MVVTVKRTMPPPNNILVLVFRTYEYAFTWQRGIKTIDGIIPTLK
jgi:hypothetical protein